MVLFAALIGPYFIDWNNYKSTFETEAEKILGQPVRVNGTASATLLPLPSLTFTNVAVGDTEGEPMMTVDHFEVTIELMPLLEGEIRVVSMSLQKPAIKVSVDDSGTVDWLIRTEASKALNPEKVVLEDVQIVDGSAAYIDGSSGIKLDLQHINASITATALTGPWRIEGNYQQGDSPVQFEVTTGKWDGSAIRVKTSLNPANVPLTVSAEGAVGNSDEGLSYNGTYDLAEVVPTGDDGKPVNGGGWRSEGAFDLSRDRLVINKAVVSQGPPDRPASLAGSLTLDLGEKARFTAVATARQLDLDRSLGNGPSEPVNVSVAAQSFVDWLGSLYVPPIPGKISFSVPAIVVGGAIIQDVAFDASPETGGWQIDGFHARLPGQASLDAGGTLSTGGRVGFGGQIHLAVAQPATFAAWWRGKREQGAGLLLAPFDLAGQARIEVGRISVESMRTRIGDELISGSFAWSAGGGESGKRLLETDLKASRLDFDQIKALTELIIGRDLADIGVLADSYSVKLAADELAIEDVIMHDVTVDAGFVDGALTVNGVLIGDIGGARLSVTRGEVEDIFTAPRGSLEAHLNAADVVGLARTIDRIMPDTDLSRWLMTAAPALSPAAIDAKIEAPARDGSANIRVAIHGSANATTFDANADLKGSPAAWQTGDAVFSASLSSYDALSLARQTGLDVADIEQPGSAKLDISAKGVPANGLATTVAGNFAGLDFGADGNLILANGLPPAFKGTFKLNTADLDPLFTMARFAIPGVSGATPVSLAGNVATLGATADLDWTSGSIAGRVLGGKVRLTGGEAIPRIDGEVSIDSVDFGWLTSLGLGYPLLPSGDAAEPWAKAPFGEPTFAGFGGKIAVDAGRLTVTDGLDLAKAKLTFGLGQDHVDLDVLAGEIAGGTLAGGLSIHNVGGNANLTGHFSVSGANLESLIWERNGRPVATGSADLSANFEATGRSTASLVSSLTGGGTLAIHNGEARYTNPEAASLVVRASDLGQQFTDQALADLFANYIDGGSLPFGDADGGFAIAAGTARLNGLSINSGKTKAVASAEVDLNTLALDSDWTVTFDPGDSKVEGATPQVGIVFRGPLVAPTRTFDVVQFGSYLNIRQEIRLQEILSQQEAVRLEKERFNREKRKLREDADRMQQEREAAKAFRIASAARLEDFHNRREVYFEEKATQELAAAKAAVAATAKATAEQAVAEHEKADQLASDAAEAVTAAKKAADDAAAVVADKTNAEQQAADAVVKASADASAAKAAVDAAVAKAQTQKDAATAAARTADEKAAALATANDALAKAQADKSAADDAAAKASDAVAAALAAVKKAEGDVAAQAAVLEKAKKASAQAQAQATKAADEAAKIADAKAVAERDVGEKIAAVQETADALTAAGKEKDVADAAAKSAADKLADAKALLQQALAESDAAKTAYEAATKQAADAADAAEAAAASAQATADDAAAKQAAAEQAAQAATAAAEAVGVKVEAAKIARAKADGAKLAADAAEKAIGDTATAAAAAKSKAEVAAADAVSKKTIADPLAARASEARQAASAAAKMASDAQKLADAAAAAATAAADDATKKHAEAAAAPVDQATAAHAAAEAADQAFALAAARAADAKAKADAAVADAKAKEDAAKTAEAAANGPTKEAEDAAKAAVAAAAEAAATAEAADKAVADAKAKADAAETAESDAAAAKLAADDAAKAVPMLNARATAAADAASAATAKIAPAKAAAEKAATDKIAADKLADEKSAARDASLERLGAQKAAAADANKTFADADSAAKAAGEKAQAAAAAASEAGSAKEAADKTVAEATDAYTAATARVTEAKAAADKAASDLAAAEEAAKAAEQALAQARNASDNAVADEAIAQKAASDKAAAAEAAADAARVAADAKAAADADAKSASDRADMALAEVEKLRKIADAAAAAETSARNDAEATKADRVAAEQAAAAASTKVAEAQAAAKTAADQAKAKAAAAEAAITAAEAAAKEAGMVLAMKTPRLGELDDGQAGGVSADVPVAPAAAPAAAVPDPPKPPRRPVKITPKRVSPAPGPLIILPPTAQ